MEAIYSLSIFNKIIIEEAQGINFWSLLSPFDFVWNATVQCYCASEIFKQVFYNLYITLIAHFSYNMWCFLWCFTLFQFHLSTFNEALQSTDVHSWKFISKQFFYFFPLISCMFVVINLTLNINTTITTMKMYKKSHTQIHTFQSYYVQLKIYWVCKMMTK